MLQKPKRYVNKEYKNYITAQPCCITNRQGVDPHHVKSVGSGGSDLTQIPLIHELHQEGHKIGWETFQKKYNVDFNEVRIGLLEKYIKEGRL